jgi:ribonuclease E
MQGDAPPADAMECDGMPQGDDAPMQHGEPRQHPQHPHHQQQQHEHGNGEGGRRRRRGRRGGRRRGRRDGEPHPQHAGQQDPFADPRYPEPAPGVPDDVNAQLSNAPRDDVPPPRRIEGPGDAYDWPWNRRAERFPEEVAREAERDSERDVMPAASHAPAEPAPMVSAPRAVELPREPEPTPAPPAAPQIAAEAPPPVDEPPAGPPRRGWWRRLTQ